MVGSTVCLDLDKSKLCEAGEPSAVTDSEGKYSLSITPEIQQNAGYASANIILYGGIDSDTNKPFKGLMSAPKNDSAIGGDGSLTANITAVTTLITKAVEKGASVAAATANVKSALGIPESVPADADPIDLVLNPPAGVDPADAQAFLATNVAINRAIETMVTAAQTYDSGVDETAVTESVYDALSTTLGNLTAPVAHVGEAFTALATDTDAQAELESSDASTVATVLGNVAAVAAVAAEQTQTLYEAAGSSVNELQEVGLTSSYVAEVVANEVPDTGMEQDDADVDSVVTSAESADTTPSKSQLAVNFIVNDGISLSQPEIDAILALDMTALSEFSIEAIAAFIETPALSNSDVAAVEYKLDNRLENLALIAWFEGHDYIITDEEKVAILGLPNTNVNIDSSNITYQQVLDYGELPANLISQVQHTIDMAVAANNVIDFLQSGLGLTLTEDEQTAIHELDATGLDTGNLSLDSSTDLDALKELGLPSTVVTRIDAIVTAMAEEEAYLAAKAEAAAAVVTLLENEGFTLTPEDISAIQALDATTLSDITLETVNTLDLPVSLAAEVNRLKMSYDVIALLQANSIPLSEENITVIKGLDATSLQTLSLTTIADLQGLPQDVVVSIYENNNPDVVQLKELVSNMNTWFTSLQDINSPLEAFDNNYKTALSDANQQEIKLLVSSLDTLVKATSYALKMPDGTYDIANDLLIPNGFEIQTLVDGTGTLTKNGGEISFSNASVTFEIPTSDTTSDMIVIDMTGSATVPEQGVLTSNVQAQFNNLSFTSQNIQSTMDIGQVNVQVLFANLVDPLNDITELPLSFDASLSNVALSVYDNTLGTTDMTGNALISGNIVTAVTDDVPDYIRAEAAINPSEFTFNLSMEQGGETVGFSISSEVLNADSFIPFNTAMLPKITPEGGEWPVTPDSLINVHLNRMGSGPDDGTVDVGKRVHIEFDERITNLPGASAFAMPVDLDYGGNVSWLPGAKYINVSFGPGSYGMNWQVTYFSDFDALLNDAQNNIYPYMFDNHETGEIVEGWYHADTSSMNTAAGASGSLQGCVDSGCTSTTGYNVVDYQINADRTAITLTSTQTGVSYSDASYGSFEEAVVGVINNSGLGIVNSTAYTSIGEISYNFKLNDFTYGADDYHDPDPVNMIDFELRAYPDYDDNANHFLEALGSISFTADLKKSDGSILPNVTVGLSVDRTDFNSPTATISLAKEGMSNILISSTLPTTEGAMPSLTITNDAAGQAFSIELLEMPVGNKIGSISYNGQAFGDVYVTDETATTQKMYIVYVDGSEGDLFVAQP
jgi:hypothetical protein